MHAALIAKADAIVTEDQRAGFTTAPIIREAAIEVLGAAEFAANTVAAHPSAGVLALAVMSRRRSNPPETLRQILNQLVARYTMVEVAEILDPLIADAGGP